MSRFLTKIVFVLILVALACSGANSQKIAYGGLELTLENSSGSFRPGIGGFYERLFTRHSGIQAGLHYRTYLHSGTVTIVTTNNTTVANLSVSEKYLSIPILYEYSSKLINIYAGPTFDFFTGWKQKDKRPELTVDRYSVDPTLSVGSLIKVGKSFSLNTRMIVEPEIRFNLLFNSQRTYTGIGIMAKYKLMH